jgi:CarD family transcriptional regulator
MAAKALSFDVGDYVVYPKHGVGRVIELQSTDIAGMKLELYVLRFEKERMTLRVPTNKAESVGMRKLSSDKTMQEALTTLKGKPKVKRTMWSRRAQEYEAKINSGDLASIAEVVRDLFRPDDAPEQSYSSGRFRGGLHAPGARAGGDGADRRGDRARQDARHPEQGRGWTCQGQGTGPRRLRPCAQDETKGAAPATVPPFSLVAPPAELVY